jgi:hypothetical protein
LLGSIAGIAEMTKEAVTQQAAQAGVPKTSRAAAGTVAAPAVPGRPAGT